MFQFTECFFLVYYYTHGIVAIVFIINNVNNVRDVIESLRMKI